MRGLRRYRSLRHFDDQWKEIRAYEHLRSLARESIWEHVPRYFGTVETDFGIGIVTRLFTNVDGSIPLNLEELLTRSRSGYPQQAIEQFKSWLRRELFLSRNLLPHNIIAVRQSHHVLKLVIVDGIGNSEFIPISTWFTSLARRKIERRIQFFDHRVELLCHAFEPL